MVQRSMSNPSPKLRPARTQVLIDAAGPIFNEFGFHRASMSALAAGADVTGTSLYRHFSNKEDLLAAVIEHGTSLVEDALDDAIRSADTPAARLQGALERLARLAIDQRHYGAVLQREIRNIEPARAEALRGRWHRLVATLGSLIGEARKDRLTDWDLELLARATFAVAASQSYGQPSRMSLTRARKLMVKLLHVAARTDVTSQAWAPPPPVRDTDAFREHAAKRWAIMSAATRLFGARGFYNVSLDEIAEAVGVTVPTVYSYFDDKAALLLAGQEAGTGWLRLTITNALAADISPQERLTRVLHGYATFGVENTYLVAVVVHDIHDLPDERRGRAVERGFVDEIVAMLQAHRAELARPEADAMVRAGLAVVNEITRTRRYLGRAALLEDLTGLTTSLAHV
jgi:AcrR family transcriptional regulator